jgi:hypothetical protein
MRPNAIEIFDKDEHGILAVELRDLLAIIEREASGLVWALLDLETNGSLRGGRSMLALEEAVRAADRGVILRWEELRSLAADHFQIVNALIVGCTTEEEIPPITAGSALYTVPEIVIEAIDSSLWRIQAKKPQVIAQVRARFRDTVAVPLAS